MNYKIIGSSSKGNSIILENKLLLDAGVSYTKLKDYIKDIKAIYISHSHKDHLNPITVKQIAYMFPRMVFITGSEVVVKKLYECGVNKKKIFYLKPYIWYNLGIFQCKLEELTHDTPNYALKVKYREQKAIYIVDTSNVNNIVAKDYDLYLIESNYREDILQQHIEECVDEGTLYYLDRVPNTHLSYEQANGFLINNMGDNSEYQYIHESSYNFEERE